MAGRRRRETQAKAPRRTTKIPFPVLPRISAGTHQEGLLVRWLLGRVQEALPCDDRCGDDL